MKKLVILLKWSALSLLVVAAYMMGQRVNCQAAAAIAAACNDKTPCASKARLYMELNAPDELKAWDDYVEITMGPLLERAKKGDLMMIRGDNPKLHDADIEHR